MHQKRKSEEVEMSQESEGLVCHICNEKSNSENDLFAHLEKIHDFDLKQIADEQDGTENDEKCKFCGRIFTFKMSFVRHVARHGISEMKCYLCNAFSSFLEEEKEKKQKQFESHMFDIHTINIADMIKNQVSDFNCNFCYYSFSTGERLKEHEVEKNHQKLAKNEENNEPKHSKFKLQKNTITILGIFNYGNFEYDKISIFAIGSKIAFFGLKLYTFLHGSGHAAKIEEGGEEEKRNYLNIINPQKSSGAKNVCKAPIHGGGICGKNVQVEWRPRQTGGVEMRAKNFCDEHAGKNLP